MKPTPDWQAVRISHLDLTLAWMVCRLASTGSGGPISLVASNYGVPASIVQKAVDRVEDPTRPAHFEISFTWTP